MELEFVFKKFLSLGVHKKDSQWLAVNKFLSNSKTYLRFFLSPFLVSPFSLSHFFPTNEDFEHLSKKKDPFNQIIRK